MLVQTNNRNSIDDENICIGIIDMKRSQINQTKKEKPVAIEGRKVHFKKWVKNGGAKHVNTSSFVTSWQKASND